MLCAEHACLPHACNVKRTKSTGTCILNTIVIHALRLFTRVFANSPLYCTPKWFRQWYWWKISSCIHKYSGFICFAGFCEIAHLSHTGCRLIAGKNRNIHGHKQICMGDLKFQKNMIDPHQQGQYSNLSYMIVCPNIVCIRDHSITKKLKPNGILSTKKYMNIFYHANAWRTNYEQSVLQTYRDCSDRATTWRFCMPTHCPWISSFQVHILQLVRRTRVRR